MTLEEAKAWLRGERSSTNYVPVTQDRIEVEARVDAHMTMQAYYIVKAHKEGLV